MPQIQLKSTEMNIYSKLSSVGHSTNSICKPKKTLTMYIYASEASGITTSHIMDFKKQKEKSISSSSKLINHLCSFNRIHTTRKEAKGMRQTRKSLFHHSFLRQALLCL